MRALLSSDGVGPGLRFHVLVEVTQDTSLGKNQGEGKFHLYAWRICHEFYRYLLCINNQTIYLALRRIYRCIMVLMPHSISSKYSGRNGIDSTELHKIRMCSELTQGLIESVDSQTPQRTSRIIICILPKLPRFLVWTFEILLQTKACRTSGEGTITHFRN